MYQQFKGKFSTPVSSLTIGFLYNANIFIKNSTHIANFDFSQEASSSTVALNSSHNWKLLILTFSFALNTFLSPRNNSGKSINSNALLLLNVSELHNASQISDNWLRVRGNPALHIPWTFLENILQVTLQVDNYKVLCFNKNPFLKIHFSLIFKWDQQKMSFHNLKTKVIYQFPFDFFTQTRG